LRNLGVMCDGQFERTDCVQNAIQDAVGGDTTKVDNCVKYSGSLEGNGINTILEKYFPPKSPSESRLYESWVAPLLSVESFDYIDMFLSNSTVVEAICSRFVVGKQPRICTQCTGLDRNEDWDSCLQLLASKKKTSTESTSTRNKKNQGFGLKRLLLLFLVAIGATLGVQQLVQWQRAQNLASTHVRVQSSCDEDDEGITGRTSGTEESFLGPETVEMGSMT
jgi:hypothetical protein